MFNLLSFVNFSPTTLTVDDVTHIMTLIYTCGLNEILGFEIWEKKIEGEGDRDDDDCGRTKGGLMARKRRQNAFYVKVGGEKSEEEESVLKNGYFGGGSVSFIVSLRGSNTLNSNEKGERRV